MGSKLPIFVISGKSPKGDSGGYPAYAYSLSHVLSDLNYRVFTLAIGGKNSIEKDRYVEIHTLGSRLLRIVPVFKHLALSGLPYYSILFALEIKKILEKEKIDEFVLWGMGPWAFAGVLLKLILPKQKRMIMLSSYFTSTRHEMKGALDAIKLEDYGLIPKLRYFLVYEIVARLFHVFEKLTLFYSDGIVIHYNSTRKIIKKYFNVSDKKIYEFPWYNEIFKRQGNDVDMRKNYPHPFIVSICRQDPRKGLNFLIRAIEILKKEFPAIYCEIVGTGSFLKNNKKLVDKLSLEKNIHLPGFVADIKPLLSQADIAVIVPLAQGSSALAVLEAMSYKKAIVGSDCDGIPEDITDGVSGLIVKKGDAKDLSKALRRLIKNPELRKKLGTNAYNAYKNRFGFEKMKRQIDRLLRSATQLPQ